jgi:hypothetical protein
MHALFQREAYSVQSFEAAIGLQEILHFYEGHDVP